MGERLEKLAASAPSPIPLLSFLGSLVLILLTGIWLNFTNTSSLATQVATQTAEITALKMQYLTLRNEVDGLPPEKVVVQIRAIQRQCDRIERTINAWHGPPGQLLP